MSDHPHRYEDDAEVEVEVLDEQARLSRLVQHLALLVRRGGRVEEQQGYRAVVSMPRRSSMLPNVVMAAAGVGLYLWLNDAFFLLAAGVAFLGWHRKLVQGVQYVRLHVRVDDVGRITERELGGTA
jgi:hypothetical protein